MSRCEYIYSSTGNRCSRTDCGKYCNVHYGSEGKYISPDVEVLIESYLPSESLDMNWIEDIYNARDENRYWSQFKKERSLETREDDDLDILTTLGFDILTAGVNGDLFRKELLEDDIDYKNLGAYIGESQDIKKIKYVSDLITHLNEESQNEYFDNLMDTADTHQNRIVIDYLNSIQKPMYLTPASRTFFIDSLGDVAQRILPAELHGLTTMMNFVSLLNAVWRHHYDDPEYIISHREASEYGFVEKDGFEWQNLRKFPVESVRILNRELKEAVESDFNSIPNTKVSREVYKRIMHSFRHLSPYISDIDQYEEGPFNPWIFMPVPGARILSSTMLIPGGAHVRIPERYLENLDIIIKEQSELIYKYFPIE